MREDYTTNIFFFSLEIIDIRNDIIDTWHIFFWKLKSHIDNHDIIPIFKDGHIATYFFLSTKRNDTETLLTKSRNTDAIVC